MQTMRQIYNLLFCSSVVVFIISFQVVVNDLFVVILTGLHRLQEGGKASVQSGEVWFREEGGHACQRILGQRVPHDITQTKAGEGQEAQAEEGGATDPTNVDGEED